MADSSSTLSSREWQSPPAGTAESYRIGWLNESCEEGQNWLRAQRGYGDFRKSLDILSGIDTTPTIADYRSKVSSNRLKRNFREVTGSLAKLRPIWGYHSDNKAYAANAQMMNMTSRAWYLKSFADIKIKEALQYAGATGRGWAVPVYRRRMYGTGKGDIVLFTYGAPCILPNQLPSSGDWQEAYCIHRMEEMPVAMAHGMFPAFQHLLNPHSARYWYMSDSVKKAATGNWLSRAFRRVSGAVGGASTDQLTDLLVPMRYSYILDLSINRTDREIPMGEPGASWSYTVPYVGQDIPVGMDPRTNQMSYRKANETDARLYPYRRLIISSDTCIPYDGPGFDWHGMFPGVSFTLDSFPWEPLGFSLVRDGYEIQHAINKILRGNMDKVSAQLNPSYAYDTNATTRAEASRVDPFRPNERMGYDGSAVEGTPFTPLVDAQSLRVEPESMAMIEKLESTLDAQMAIKDVMNLAKMRAVGSMDELEKIVEANGPIIEDMSRSMESPMSELGEMIKYLICQYYTTTRVMQVIGVDGVPPEVFDFDPAKLIPSHMPGEDPARNSLMNPIQRARTFADNLQFLIMPGSLHELTQMSMKLGLLQLKKAGVKISSQMLAEAWSVPNYGKFDGNDEIEKWKSEQELDLEFAARMMAIKTALGGGAPPSGPSNPEGRPNSNTAPPALAQKDNGTRSTVTTSK